MISFRQFLEEAKQKKIDKLQQKKGKLSKKEVMAILNSQGGIGAKAVQKYNEKNPDRGVTYSQHRPAVQEDRMAELKKRQQERVQAERDRVAEYKRKRQEIADREDEQAEIIKRIEKIKDN